MGEARLRIRLAGAPPLGENRDPNVRRNGLGTRGAGLLYDHKAAVRTGCLPTRGNNTMTDPTDEAMGDLTLATVADEMADDKSAILDLEEEAATMRRCEYCGCYPCGCGG